MIEEHIKDEYFIFPEIYYDDKSIFESVKIRTGQFDKSFIESPRFKSKVLEYYSKVFLPIFINPNSMILSKAIIGNIGTEANRYDINNYNITNHIGFNYVPEYKDAMFLFHLITLSTFRKVKHNTDITDVGNCILTTEDTKIFLNIGPIKISWYITDPKYITITSPYRFNSKVKVDINALYDELIRVESNLDYNIFTKESILYKISKSLDEEIE